MNAAQLLEQVRARGIVLTSDGGVLRYEAPAGRLTEELKEAIRARKGELLSLLSAGQKRPFWAVFGLGGPSACWRITEPSGIERIAALWPEATPADVARIYPGSKVEQMFTEQERQELLASQSARECHG